MRRIIAIVTAAAITTVAFLVTATPTFAEIIWDLQPGGDRGGAAAHRTVPELPAPLSP